MQLKSFIIAVISSTLLVACPGSPQSTQPTASPPSTPTNTQQGSGTNITVTSAEQGTGTTVTTAQGTGTTATATSSGTPTATTNNPAPSLVTISPQSGLVTGGTTISLTGTGFSTSVKVNIGNSPCSPATVVSSTNITCVTPIGAIGGANVVVTNSDSQSATAVSAFTYFAQLALTPGTKALAVNNTASFAVAGGVSPYTYAVTSGAISSSGVYSAPNTPGSAIVTATDSRGNQATASVTVNAALAISPSTKALAVGNTSTFSASGGVPPYTYSVVSVTGGTFNGGAYTAPNAAGTYTVRVTDSIANTSAATVTVNAALSITPGTKTVAVNNSFTLTASGGVGPYTYSATNGSVTSNGGVFTAPSSSGSSTVTVTDSLNNQATASVTINPALAISPSTALVIASGTITYSATGGVSSYTYFKSSGVGSISGNTYVASSSSGTAVVSVSDSVGNTSNSSITVCSPGTLDTTFGTSGVGGGSGRLSVVQTDGKIVTFGSGTNTFVVKRANGNGTVDSAFGTSGTSTATISATDGAWGGGVLTNGQILALGDTSSGFAAARFSSSGTLDSSFGTSGVATIPLTITHSGSGNFFLFGGAIVQSDGKYLFLASAELNNTSQYIVLARMNADGTPDNSFGSNGVAVAPATVSSNILFSSYRAINAYSISQQTDGKILVGANDGTYLILARFTTSGNLDTTFNSTGYVQKSTAVLGTPAIPKSVVEYQDGTGNILVGGQANSTIALLRFTSAGALDTSFGTNGIQNTGKSLSNYVSVGIVASTNKIISASDSSSLCRYGTNGTIDSGFGTSGCVTLTNGGVLAGNGLTFESDGSILAQGANGLNHILQ